jgi:hypothetical protein
MTGLGHFQPWAPAGTFRRAQKADNPADFKLTSVPLGMLTHWRSGIKLAPGLRRTNCSSRWSRWHLDDLGVFNLLGLVSLLRPARSE